MTIVNNRQHQALIAGDADAYAQEILRNGPNTARVIERILTERGNAAFMAGFEVRAGFAQDVATLLRLETQSDETPHEASQRTRDQFRHMSHGHVLATHEVEQNPERKAELAAEIQRRGCA